VQAQPSTQQEQREPKYQTPKCPLPPWTDPFWPNWTLVLVTLGAVLAALGTLADLKEQTAAAKRSAEFAQKAVVVSERADILLDAASIVPLLANGIIGPDSRLKLQYKNFGRTRARDVRFKVQMEIPAINLPNAVQEHPPMVMGAGQDQTITFQTFRECLTEITFKQIVQGKIELRFIALVTYEDVFGGLHTTRDAGLFDTRTMAFRVLDKIAG
jgi:hypothetical protein